MDDRHNRGTAFVSHGAAVVRGEGGGRGRVCAAILQSLVLFVDFFGTTKPIPQSRNFIMQLLVSLLECAQLLGHHDVLPGLGNVGFLGLEAFSRLVRYDGLLMIGELHHSALLTLGSV